MMAYAQPLYTSYPVNGLDTAPQVVTDEKPVATETAIIPQ
jgi:hypothetical protein